MDDSTKDDKKQKVLHTRVSSSLEEDLKKRAAELGVSVSNLVRNVLTNAFDMVEDVVADTGRVVKTAAQARDRAPAGSAGAASMRLGYQPLVLDLNAVCEQCNAVVGKGQDGAVAVFDRPGPREFLCKTCFAAQRAGDSADDRSGGDR